MKFPYKFTSSNIAKVFKKAGLPMSKKIKRYGETAETEGVRIFSVKGTIIATYEMPLWLKDELGKEEYRKRSIDGPKKMYEIAIKNGLKPVINGKKADLQDVVKKRGFAVSLDNDKQEASLVNILKSKGHKALASKVKLTLSATDDEKEKEDFIAFLKSIEKNIPKAIKEIKENKIGLTTSSLVGKMIGIVKGEDWYKHFFG